MIRQIIHIDEQKCNGCGLCADACHEGAIAMVDGVAKLIRDDYCDGMGDCLPACPTGAISFEEREAAEYNRPAVGGSILEAVKLYTDRNGHDPEGPVASEHINPKDHVASEHTGGCPGSRIMSIVHDVADATEGAMERAGIIHKNPARNDVAKRDAVAGQRAANEQSTIGHSQLTNWPVQIKLAPVQAPYYDGAKLLIAADCTAFAYGNFHNEFIKGKTTLIGCPKLDAVDYSEKLTEIIRNNDIKSVTIVRMQVPCCGGLAMAAQNALKASGKFIPWSIVTIGMDGTILED